MLGQHAVIGLGIDVVTRCGDQIEALAVAAAVRRAFEPADEEAFEQGAGADDMRYREFGRASLDLRMRSALVADSAVAADDRSDLGDIACHAMASEIGAALG